MPVGVSPKPNLVETIREDIRSGGQVVGRMIRAAVGSGEMVKFIEEFAVK